MFHGINYEKSSKSISSAHLKCCWSEEKSIVVKISTKLSLMSEKPKDYLIYRWWDWKKISESCRTILMSLPKAGEKFSAQTKALGEDFLPVYLKIFPWTFPNRALVFKQNESNMLFWIYWPSYACTSLLLLTAESFIYFSIFHSCKTKILRMIFVWYFSLSFAQIFYEYSWSW